MDTPRTEIDKILTKRIMQKVYWTWFLRSVAPLLAVEGLLLAGVAVGVLTHISIRHIFLNAFSASGDVKAFFLFFINNFFVKSIQSRLLVLAFAALAFFFVRDIRSTLRKIHTIGISDIFTASLLTGNRRPY